MSKLRPEDVLRLLRNAHPDQLQAVKRPDGTLDIHFVPVKPARVGEGKGKWAKVAEKMAEENLLGEGRGDRLRQAIREFRDNFAFRDVIIDPPKR